MSKEDEITPYNFEIDSTGGDYGFTIKSWCPKCGDEIRLSELSSSYDKDECFCGYTWDLKVIITGKKLNLTPIL